MRPLVSADTVAWCTASTRALKVRWLLVSPVAVPTETGGVDVYSPVQHPYLLQRTIAKVLALTGLPPAGTKTLFRMTISPSQVLP